MDLHEAIDCGEVFHSKKVIPADVIELCAEINENFDSVNSKDAHRSVELMRIVEQQSNIDDIGTTKINIQHDNMTFNGKVILVNDNKMNNKKKIQNLNAYYRTSENRLEAMFSIQRKIVLQSDIKYTWN